MKLRKGNMFDSGADVLAVTTNAFIRRDGALVMGKGAAYDATQYFPGCASVFGGLVREWAASAMGNPYCVLVHPGEYKPQLAIFQVKWHFREAASMDLIRASVAKLCFLAVSDWEDRRIALTFPGIGNGGLRRRDVLPCLMVLPNNVEVWELS